MIRARNPRQTLSVIALAVAGLLACGCAAPRGPALLTTRPAVKRQSIAAHLVGVSLLSPALDLARMGRQPSASSDLAGGEVPDSSFFTNRDIARLSPERVQAGPTQPGWRAQPPFTVTRIKEEGKTGGFVVRDAKGDRYLFKLDALGYPELVTGDEVVASKLLHAVGYYVPSYEIEQVRVADLHLDSSIDPEEYKEIEELVRERVTGGRVRVSASRYLEGEILGPFRFADYRRLAELRALRVLYAWLNNTDAKDHNTLMVWTGDRAVGYLIDFGTSLGGDAGRGAKRACRGWVYDVDLGNGLWELLTLGLHDNGCDPRARPHSPATGTFSARFDPRRWKPYAPNLAFEEMTEADAQWIAGKLARLSQAQVAAAVDAGRYTDPADAQYLVEMLEARRRTILDTYLGAPEEAR